MSDWIPPFSSDEHVKKKKKTAAESANFISLQPKLLSSESLFCLDVEKQSLIERKKLVEIVVHQTVSFFAQLLQN